MDKDTRFSKYPLILHCSKHYRVTYSPVKLIYRVGSRYGPQSVGGKQAEGGKCTGS